MSDAKAENREEYLRERKLLIDWEHSSTTSFDKAMLTLSSGALALSLAYLRDLGGTKPWAPALYGCWLLFAVAVLATTWSFLLSQHALRRQRHILDAKYRAKKQQGGTSCVNRWASRVSCLNWCAVIALTLGVIFLAVYAISGQCE